MALFTRFLPLFALSFAVAGAYFDCGFDGGNTCGYQPVRRAYNFQWRVYNKARGTGWLYVTPKKGSALGDTTESTRVESKPSQLPRSTYCLTFRYRMVGTHVGRLRVGLTEQDPKGSSRDYWLFDNTGNQGDEWSKVKLTVEVPKGKVQRKLTVEATRVKKFRGQIAVDDIHLSADNSECKDPVGLSCSFVLSHCGWIGIGRKGEGKWYWAGASTNAQSGLTNLGPKFDGLTGTQYGYWLQYDIDGTTRLRPMVSPKEKAIPQGSMKCIRFRYYLGNDYAGLQAGLLLLANKKGIYHWKNKMGEPTGRWLTGEMNAYSSGSEAQVIMLPTKEKLRDTSTKTVVAVDDVSVHDGVCPTRDNNDFENGFGSYTNYPKQTFNWLVRSSKGNILNIADHTTDTKKGHFAVAFFKGQRAESAARMYSPTFDGSQASCLIFSYYFTIGPTASKNKLYVSTRSLQNGQIKTINVGLRRPGRPNGWTTVALPLNEGGQFVISFIAVSAGNTNTSLAIDDIIVTATNCKGQPVVTDQKAPRGQNDKKYSKPIKKQESKLASNDSSKPATTEASKPTSTEGFEPASTKHVKSTATEPITTAITEASTPAITEASTPAITEASTPSITEPSTPAITEPSTPAITEASTPAFTEASTPAFTEATTPGITEPSTPTITEASTLLVTTDTYKPTTAKASKLAATDASTPITTKASTSAITEASTPATTKANTPAITEASTPTTTKASAPAITEASTPDTTEASTPDTTKASTPAIIEPSTLLVTTDTNKPTTTKASTPFITEHSTPVITEANTPTATEASTPDTTKASNPAITEASTPAITETNTPAATEASTPAITEASTPAITEASTPAITEASTPAITEASTPATTEATTPATTEPSTPVITEASTPATTEVNTPATTEVNTPATIEASALVTTEASNHTTTETSTPVSKEASKLLVTTDTNKPTTTKASTPDTTEASTPVSKEASKSESTEVIKPASTEASIVATTEGNKHAPTKSIKPTDKEDKKEIKTSDKKDTQDISSEGDGDDDSPWSSGKEKAGSNRSQTKDTWKIPVGIVLGFAGLACIVIGVVFYVKRRKRLSAPGYPSLERPNPESSPSYQNQLYDNTYAPPSVVNPGYT